MTGPGWPDLLEQHGTPSIFMTADLFHARMHRHVAMGMIKKPYDTAMMPAIVGYLDELAQGRPPAAYRPSSRCSGRTDPKQPAK